jgi:4-amino-4-deoxy-L-arabinose transferase-like glycosyltransferase
MGRKITLLFLIFLLGFILRFYQLGAIPASVEWDEAAIGYDAYSLLNTGKDQFGKFFPNTFRSLDDWKPPIYEYTAIPSIAVWGLNAFAVRFPSAFFGSFSVLAVYFLVRTVFLNINFWSKRSVKLGLLASFLLAVSPWSLQFSRAAFEVNVSVFITILAVTTFIKGLTNNRFFILSAFLFGLDLFSYHSTRIVAPLLLISLFIIFNKQLPIKKIMICFFLILSFFIVFFIPIARSPEAQIRFKATNIFNPGARYLDERDLDREFLDMRQTDSKAGFDLAGRIFHNQRLIYTDYETLKKSLGHYLSNFGFEFLFVKGDVPLHHAPSFGLLHLIEFPIIFLGIIFILFKGLNKYTIVFLLWLLFVPIPDAVTREAPHAVRSELFLPVWQILGAVGLFTIYRFLKRESEWVIMFFVIGFVSLFAINHAFYLHQYYVHTDYELSKNWLYGREEAVSFTEKVKGEYDKVLVSMKVDMPYIFWLFYSKYSPQKYLTEGGTVSGGFADERNKFDKYEFRNFDNKNIAKEEKLLLVSTPDNFPSEARILKTIYYRNGTEALRIGTNK